MSCVFDKQNHLSSTYIHFGDINFSLITSIQDMKQIQLMDRTFEMPWIDTILWTAQAEAVGFGGINEAYAF